MITGDYDSLNLLIERVSHLQGFRHDYLQEAVPTLRKLLSAATSGKSLPTPDDAPKSRARTQGPGLGSKRGKNLQGPSLPGGQFRSQFQPNARRPQQGPTLPGQRSVRAKQLQGPTLRGGQFTSGDVPPVKARWAGRRYSVSNQVQARIDANTKVEARHGFLEVTTGGQVHLRPVVPIGSLPLKWRQAIAAKVKGAIRRGLKG